MGCSIKGLVFIYFEWHQDGVQFLLGYYCDCINKVKKEGRDFAFRMDCVFTSLETQHHRLTTDLLAFYQI